MMNFNDAAYVYSLASGHDVDGFSNYKSIDWNAAALCQQAHGSQGTF